ncbi:flagellar hook-associated protein FlgL [Thermatribacter velox]|uniref:Flagellar hook-associated protein FlgL n=1 Tax=Thermatribacter velox TaxID=3039681 RepID=A0ABZ2YDC2_9BACT
MRVTQRVLSDRVMQNLNNILERMVRIEDVLSSGKAIRRPSDDPIKINNILSLKTSISKLEQFRSNVEDARNWLNLVDESLGSATDVIQKIRTLALQGANGSLTAEDRVIIAEEVEKQLEELVSIGNISYADRYLFAGARLTEPPFVIQGNQITYLGDSNSLIREIESKTVIDISFPGDEVFFRGFEARSSNPITLNPGDQFSINGTVITIDATMTTLQDLVNAINNEPSLRSTAYAVTDGSTLVLRSRTESTLVLSDVNGTPLQDWGILDAGGNIQNTSEAEGILKVVKDLVEHLRGNQPQGIEEDISKIDQELNNLLGIRAQVGAKVQRLENALNRFEDFSLNFKTLLSSNEDIDVAEVVMQLKEHQNVYQMALAAAAQVTQPTLLDFLR